MAAGDARERLLESQPPQQPAPAPHTGPRLNKLLVNVAGYGGAALSYSCYFFLQARRDLPEHELHHYHLVLLLILWDLHFLKRVLEVLFVHKWTENSVAMGEGLGEWAYYWGFANWVGWSVHNVHNRGSVR